MLTTSATTMQQQLKELEVKTIQHKQEMEESKRCLKNSQEEHARGMLKSAMERKESCLEVAHLKKDATDWKEKAVTLEEEHMTLVGETNRLHRTHDTVINTLHYEMKEMVAKYQNVCQKSKECDKSKTMSEKENAVLLKKMKKVQEENRTMQEMMEEAEVKMSSVELVMKDYKENAQLLTEHQKEKMENEHQIATLSVTIEKLTHQLTRTMEESSFHEQKSFALTTAEMKINELNMSLHKTHGVTVNITKENNWFKKEYQTIQEKHAGKNK